MLNRGKGGGQPIVLSTTPNLPLSLGGVMEKATQPGSSWLAGTAHLITLDYLDQVTCWMSSKLGQTFRNDIKRVIQQRWKERKRLTLTGGI